MCMNRIKDKRTARLISVDISDVNDSVAKPWLKHGSDYSPAEIIGRLECGSFVEFIRSDSLDYLKQSKSLIKK